MTMTFGEKLAIYNIIGFFGAVIIIAIFFISDKVIKYQQSRKSAESKNKEEKK